HRRGVLEGMQELRQLRDPYDEEQAELPVYGHALRPRHRGGSETCGAAESQPYGRYPLRKTSQEAQARLQRQPALVRALDSLQAVRVAQVKEAKRTRRRQRPGREEILDLRTFLLVTGYRTLSPKGISRRNSFEVSAFNSTFGFPWSQTGKQNAQVT